MASVDVHTNTWCLRSIGGMLFTDLLSTLSDVSTRLLADDKVVAGLHGMRGVGFTPENADVAWGVGGRHGDCAVYA